MEARRAGGRPAGRSPGALHAPGVVRPALGELIAPAAAAPAPVAVARALFAAFARRDEVELAALADREVVLHAPTALLARRGEPYRGHAGLRRYLADVAREWDLLEAEVDEWRVAGEWVAALGRVRAHGRGNVIDAPAGWALRVSAGRVVHVRVHATRRGALDEACVEQG